MLPPKDRFSAHAHQYAQFRPNYPDELYTYIYSRTKNFDAAWDCATGNGQVALQLAHKFKQVYATDISQKQLDHATPKPHIQYTIARAEQTPFQNQQFDLITVGQALHWFNQEAFYNEARRVAKPQAQIAVWGYGVLKINNEADAIINQFYTQTIGNYWDTERHHIDTQYRNIPFPFKQVEQKDFIIHRHWQLNQLINYLNTWSGVKKFIEQNNHNPTNELATQLTQILPNNNTLHIKFPVFMLSGLFD